MNAHSETPQITAEGQEQIRAEVRLVMKEEGLSQAEVAREAGIPYGTLTPWMTDKYAGNGASVAHKVGVWLESRRERARTRAVLPAGPAFVETATAISIQDTLAFAQMAPDFAVVVGGAGIGKTTAILEYQRRSPNVTVVTAEPCITSPNNLLVAIAEELGVLEKSPNRLSRAIMARLRGANALLVIDEAQHLSSPALDQLRTIHDKAGCGIAVSGNESVFARLQGGTAQSAQFAQMHSRVGKRIVQPRSRSRDVCQIIQAWGLDGASPEAALLKKIAAKPGALRTLTKVLRLAGMLSAGAGAEAVTVRHIQQAWDQLSSSSLD